MTNYNEKHLQLLEEWLVTPASRGETRYRKACMKYFKSLLQNHADPEATILQAGVLCTVLQNLGMAPEVTEDELCGILKSSGYADENGSLGFERFMILANDLKLLESIREYKKARKRGNNIDRGRLGEFFEILDVGEETGFSTSDFIDAFMRVSTKITEETADSLVRYANLHSGVKISFQQFEKVLRKEREKYYMRIKDK